MQKTVLICLPFAGGNQYSYNQFLPFVGTDIHLIPLDLPGRGKRIAEEPLTTIDQMVADIMTSIRPYLNSRYAIYGHSMGSLLAYAVTHKIIASNMPQPIALFLSGRPAPSIVPREPLRYLLPKDDFLASLRKLGGLENLFANQDLIDFFEPILRKDLQAVETYPYQNRQAFDIPMTVIAGEDEEISDEELLAWQKESKHPIDMIRFPGNHFFIFDHAEEIMEIMSTKLSLKKMNKEVI